MCALHPLISPSLSLGGPHTVPYLVTMFEYCLVAGIDFWDLTLCAKATHIDQLCDKLTENFDFQPASVQKYYFNRYMSIKMSLFRYVGQLEHD